MSTPPHEPITGPLGAIEPNVVLAGLEGVVTAWLAASVLRGALIPLPLPNEWRWFYLVYAIAAMLGLVLVGLVVEGVAGLVEYIVTRHLWGREKGELHRWYVRATRPPSDWGQGQRWMWKSPLASAEFARRRTRLLLSRNTALCLLILTVVVAIAIIRSRPTYCAWWVLLDVAGGLLATALFVWLWLSAHRGWHQAVHDAGAIGPP